MTLSANDAQRLKNAGFTDYEIDLLSNAKDPEGKDQPPINIDGDAWKATIKSRSDWWDDKIAKGWNRQEIINELMNYYQRDERRTPFDFLKAEYRPRKRVDYFSIMREMKKIGIEDTLGEYPTPERTTPSGEEWERKKGMIEKLGEGLYGTEPSNE